MFFLLTNEIVIQQRHNLCAGAGLVRREPSTVFQLHNKSLLHKIYMVKFLLDRSQKSSIICFYILDVKKAQKVYVQFAQKFLFCLWNLTIVYSQLPHFRAAQPVSLMKQESVPVVMDVFKAVHKQCLLVNCHAINRR